LATASQGQVTFGGESIDINGGWSFYQLAKIDTKKTVMLSITDAQWDIDSLWLSSGGAKTSNVASQSFYYFGTPYTVASNIITLPHVAVEASVEINGFTRVASPATPGSATEFVVTPGASTTTVTFAAGAEGTVVYPSYYVSVTADTVITTQTTDFAISGSAIVQFPIYSDADADTSTIIAYAQMEIYKVKIMPQYEFSGQYKAASTFKLDLEGLDPRRDDSNMWQLMVYAI
jgi:hypothetical protein